MPNKPKTVVINVLTNEVIEREMTKEETAEQAIIHLEQQVVQAEQEAKIAARTSALAKLAALGLTEEEIGAL